MVGLPLQDSLVKHHAVLLAGSVPLRFASYQQIQIEDSPSSVCSSCRERAPMRDDVSLEVARLRQVPILVVHS